MMTPHPEGCWILVVDDDSMVRSLGRRLLEASGRRCVTAGNHDEALELVESNPRIGALILDFQMPDGDARDIVRRIRPLRPDLLIIGTSASLDAQAAFEQCGVSRFLPKPWDPNQVPALLAAD